MEKQKKWQLFLIIAVLALTLYNILPTIFYYSKPLSDPIDQRRAAGVAVEVSERIQGVQEQSVEWVHALVKHLGLNLKQLEVSKEDSSLLHLTFDNQKDARIFSAVVPRAATLFPFVPARVELVALPDTNGSEVWIERRLTTTLDAKQAGNYFTFVQKQKDHQITEEYQEIVFDRLEPVLIGLGGTSYPAQVLKSLSQKRANPDQDQMVVQLAQKIVLFDKLFGKKNGPARRYYASFTQGQGVTGQTIEKFEKLLTEMAQERTKAIDAIKKTAAEENILQRKILEKEKIALEQAAAIVRAQKSVFASGQDPLNATSSHALLQKTWGDQHELIQTITFEQQDPFVSKLIVDWAHDTVTFVLHADVQQLREQSTKDESQARQVEQINQLIIDEMANLASLSKEKIVPVNANYGFSFNELTGSQSMLVLHLPQVAKQRTEQIKGRLERLWHPTNRDLIAKNFPILTQQEVLSAPAEDRALGLWIISPGVSRDSLPEQFRNQSIYVVARGLQSLIDQYQGQKDTAVAQEFFKDLKSLKSLLEQQGFFGYSASENGFGKTYAKDVIFELPNYYAALIDATREQFTVHGTGRFSTLEFTDVQQRILAWNRIEDAMHGELIKWRDTYQAAQVNLDLNARMDVPPPSKNVYLNNLVLNWKKYFYGDERKVLKWGLDLSGGKSVHLGLQDKSGKLLSNPEDLQQAVNELYQRVNKLGVSDVGIRTQDQFIVLDFPGSQGLSAKELVQAASMSFHIVNEKFSNGNKALAPSVNEFLQQVWNEALLTNRTDALSIHQIAWRHMGGSDNPLQEEIPQSDAAATLKEQGLRLANLSLDPQTGVFDDTLSMITRLRGDDFSEWHGQSHPLMIVFYNYALEGANLENIQVGYDQAKGNMLSFSVRGSGQNADGQNVNYRDQFFAWTSQFAQEKIVGTVNENYSGGAGWRMAVVLNGNVINAPTLNAPLRDHAMITGHFTQSEVNELAADLKAGALSFTPTILSEENISPELGKQERMYGMLAALVGTLLVIVVMIAYYRFAGFVASIAVLFNLLIMWGVLQNIDAALTLPGIAGIILTIGMAVDANVLVFERIREEFARTHKLPSSVQAGYRKAFTAIVDSNLTTIIAALILMQFDSGPVKGFAVTLIVGIVTSMFTSLFMTRYFFAGWVQNPKHKKLSMAKWIDKPNFSFMNKTRITVVVSLVIVVLGLLAVWREGSSLIGMDFQGGYTLTVDLEEKQGGNYVAAAREAFVKAGASDRDFQIRSTGAGSTLRMQFSHNMNDAGHPFADMPLENDADDVTYSYENNPRIGWVVHALQENGLTIKSHQLAQLDQQWSAVSGQFSETMRNQALLGLFLAMLAILIYITIRFEFKYAISALLGIVYDLVIAMAIFTLIRLFGVDVQIDLNVIAALMTIIGYSLNDTIIIFDRIREDVRAKHSTNFKTLINHALNATLSRTLMTSGTTLVVLIALLVLGGRSIFDFSLVMTLGVVVGTLSSLFVAAPLLLYFHNKEESKQETKSSNPSLRVIK